MMRAAHMERPHTRNQGRGKEEKVQKGFLLFGPLKVQVSRYCAFAAVASSRLPSSIPLCVRARACARPRASMSPGPCVCVRAQERERERERALIKEFKAFSFSAVITWGKKYITSRERPLVM
jgi:hypothetical protein